MREIRQPRRDTRAAIAVTIGNKTRAYSLTVATAVLAVLLFAHSLLSRIPTAALGGIVIFAAIELIDVTAFRRLLAFRRAELLIAVATFVGVLVFDILYGCWSRSACPWPTCCSG